MEELYISGIMSLPSQGSRVARPSWFSSGKDERSALFIHSNSERFYPRILA